MLRREGDRIFKTGTEAVQLLVQEAQRRDEVKQTGLFTELTMLIIKMIVFRALQPFFNLGSRW